MQTEAYVQPQPNLLLMVTLMPANLGVKERVPLKGTRNNAKAWMTGVLYGE